MSTELAIACAALGCVLFGLLVWRKPDMPKEAAAALAFAGALLVAILLRRDKPQKPEKVPKRPPPKERFDHDDEIETRDKERNRPVDTGGKSAADRWRDF
jgi:hypothetical protein